MEMNKDIDMDGDKERDNLKLWLTATFTTTKFLSIAFYLYGTADFNKLA